MSATVLKWAAAQALIRRSPNKNSPGTAAETVVWRIASQAGHIERSKLPSQKKSVDPKGVRNSLGHRSANELQKLSIRWTLLKNALPEQLQNVVSFLIESHRIQFRWYYIVFQTVSVESINPNALLSGRLEEGKPTKHVLATERTWSKLGTRDQQIIPKIRQQKKGHIEILWLRVYRLPSPVNDCCYSLQAVVAKV